MSQFRQSMPWKTALACGAALELLLPGVATSEGSAPSPIPRFEMQDPGSTNTVSRQFHILTSLGVQVGVGKQELVKEDVNMSLKSELIAKGVGRRGVTAVRFATIWQGAIGQDGEICRYPTAQQIDRVRSPGPISPQTSKTVRIKFKEKELDLDSRDGAFGWGVVVRHVLEYPGNEGIKKPQDISILYSRLLYDKKRCK